MHFSVFLLASLTLGACALPVAQTRDKFDARSPETTPRDAQNRDPPAWDRRIEARGPTPQNRDPPAWDRVNVREPGNIERDAQNRDPPAWDKLDARED